MASERYEGRKPFFDTVFSCGVEPFVHPTGVVGVRLVVGVEEGQLDPFYSSPYGQRAKNAGDLSIFLADNEDTAKAEVFNRNPPSDYPPNSWLLSYRYEGNILNIQRIGDDQFKTQFLEASGDYKHEFSQDVRCYLEEKGYTEKFDSIGWVSVQGDQMGEGGFVYNWISGVMPDFEYQGKTRLDAV